MICTCGRGVFVFGLLSGGFLPCVCLEYFFDFLLHFSRLLFLFNARMRPLLSIYIRLTNIMLSGSSPFSTCVCCPQQFSLNFPKHYSPTSAYSLVPNDQYAFILFVHPFFHPIFSKTKEPSIFFHIHTHDSAFCAYFDHI